MYKRISRSALKMLSNSVFTFTYIHHHVALVARISLTLSRHSSLSFITLVRSSGQHPVFSHSCWMYVHAGCPAFARPCVGVHKSASLMSSSKQLFFKQFNIAYHLLTHSWMLNGFIWPIDWILSRDTPPGECGPWQWRVLDICQVS